MSILPELQLHSINTVNMNFITEKKLVVRLLQPHEEIPYDLLLLAEETIEAIDKHLKNAEIYILEYENRIIAVYVLQIIDKYTLEIKYIAVDARYQGRGIGKFLLEDAASKAHAREFSSILIGTGDVAVMQLNLYQKAGFVVYDKKENFFINNYPEPIYENGVQLKDMIMLRKELR